MPGVKPSTLHSTFTFIVHKVFSLVSMNLHRRFKILHSITNSAVLQTGAALQRFYAPFPTVVNKGSR